MISLGKQSLAFGLQQQFAAGVDDIGKEQTLIDATADDKLWRVACSGPAVFQLIWGTSGRQSIKNALSPMRACVPGNLSVLATPVSTGIVVCTLQPVSSDDGSFLRVYVDVTGGPVTAPDSAEQFVALAASSVTVEGNAVGLVAGETVPITRGSSLTAGAGLWLVKP